MTPQVLRGRIALLALVIAVAFVVVGFLRVDREMTRAEQDRATASASATATLVEVFLLRELTQLRTIATDIADRPDSLSGQSQRYSRLPNGAAWIAPFNSLWLLDSIGRVRSLRQPVRADMSVDSADVERLADAHLPNVPFVVVTGAKPHRTLLFGDVVDRSSHQVIVGALPADSLTSVLADQYRERSVTIVVTVLGDTVARVGGLTPNDTSRMFQQPVALPLVNGWVIGVTYAPSGRGARLALWIVGLGAIIGLGIGLLLERRETSRIADRSSELEHLSAELLRANRAKSEFLANVSHELRTPLNAIVGFVDLLRDGVYGPLNSRQAGPVERIEASANHLRHLVDQILDLAKMAAGRLEVHTEPVELRPFVFDVASEVEPLMTEKGLSLSLAVGASLPRVRTDPTHLRQILINLLGNAVKFTSNGGISVRGKLVRRTEHPTSNTDRNGVELLALSPKVEVPWIALQVADSGIGIAERDRDRIFDEFEQVNAGPRGDSMRRGTGLGLSISRRLARLLGGDITVESEVGRGSVFTVWLPIDPMDLRGDRAA